MRTLRVFPLAAIAVAVGGLVLPATWAGEPKFVPPPWGAEDIVLREKAPMPQGWSVAIDEAATAAGKAMEDGLKALATKAGIDDLDTAYESVSLKNAAGALVTLLLADVDADPKGLTAAVQEEAKAKGWTYRELGTPLRFLVASGPEDARKPAIEAQVGFAVAALTQRAFQRATQAGRAASEEGKRATLESAANVARAAIALDEKAGAPHMVLGLLAAGTADQDKAKWQQAAEEFKLAFREDATLKPDGVVALQALDSYGLALLMQKTPEGNAEAKKVLTKALDFGKFDPRGAMTGQIRYNLACALSLLGEKAEAIQQLEASLQAMKAAQPPAEFADFVNSHIPKDTDLDNIRNEPEFAAVLERVR